MPRNVSDWVFAIVMAAILIGIAAIHIRGCSREVAHVSASR